MMKTFYLELKIKTLFSNLTSFKKTSITFLKYLSFTLMKNTHLVPSNAENT